MRKSRRKALPAAGGKKAFPTALLTLLMIVALILSGCGQRLVMTKGYGKQELFRIGNTQCMLPEYNVFLLNLQKHCERTFGHEVWQEASGDSLKEAILQRALSESSRLKVAGQPPQAVFALCDGDEVEAVYAFCNLHGLWKA